MVSRPCHRVVVPRNSTSRRFRRRLGEVGINGGLELQLHADVETVRPKGFTARRIAGQQHAAAETVELGEVDVLVHRAARAEGLIDVEEVVPDVSAEPAAGLEADLDADFTAPGDLVFDTAAGV